MSEKDRLGKQEYNDELKQKSNMSLNHLPDINLLPQYERQGSRLFYLFIFMMIITLVAYVYIGYDYFTTKSSLSDVNEQYDILEEEHEQLQVRVSQKEENESHIRDAVAFVENYDMPASIFIEQLNELIPQYNYLSEYRYRNQIAEIVTHFESLDLISRYTTDLLNFDFVQDVIVNDIHTFALKNEEEVLADLLMTPRYEAKFTLQIDKRQLKGAIEADE